MRRSGFRINVGRGESIMPQTMPQADRTAQLNSVRKASPAKANLTENCVRIAGQLLRRAIEHTGMTYEDAQHALGFAHKGDFSEALDGKRKLWAHQLLRPEARRIRKELLILSALEDGDCEVERTIRIKEKSA